MKRNLKGFLYVILTIMAVFPLLNISALDDIETTTFSVTGNTLNYGDYPAKDHYTAEIYKGMEPLNSYLLSGLSDSSIISGVQTGCENHPDLCPSGPAGTYYYKLVAEDDLNHVLAESTRIPFTYSLNGTTPELLFESLPTTYTVSFNAKTTIDSQTISRGSTPTMPLNPTATGFDFIGWFADSGYTTTFDFNAPVVRDTVVYAKYKATLTVNTYDRYALAVGGGTVQIGSETAATSATKQDEIGTVLTVTASPSEGNVFMGWSESQTGAIISTNTTYAYTLNASKTLYAIFGKIFTVTSGATNTFEKNNPDDKMVSITADKDNLVSVKLNGTVISASNYDVDGDDTTTLVSFKKEYLATLANGDYTVKAVFSNGEAEATITVATGATTDPTTPDDPSTPSTPSTGTETPAETPAVQEAVLGASNEATSNPKTGDSINNYVMMLFLSVIGCASTIILKNN